MSQERGNAVRVVDRQTLVEGKKFDFVRASVEMPSGKVVEREYVRHPGAAVVVPILERDGKLHVVLVRVARFAVAEHEGDAGTVQLECCAGMLEAGEEPAACARRELIEETGYDAARVEPIGWFYTSSGMSDERIYAFVATGLREVGQQVEEDELIEVEIVEIGAAMSMVEQGEMRDGKSVAALLLAERKGMLG